MGESESVGESGCLPAHSVTPGSLPLPHLKCRLFACLLLCGLRGKTRSDFFLHINDTKAGDTFESAVSVLQNVSGIKTSKV